MNYGLPYMGSKSKIARLIGSLLPRAENFYDLFGGGGAMTHYMATARGHHFKEFHYNELNPMVCRLFRDSANGKYSPEKFIPKWIGPEEFKANKDRDPYIKYVWSFGNAGKSYLFGANNQGIKKLGHQAVVFGEMDPEFTRITGIRSWPASLKTTKARRMYLVQVVRALWGKRPRDFELQQLERLEQLEQLERLERLQQLERLKYSNLDYRKVEIKENSIVYCDPPYAETAGYDPGAKNSFDSSAFLEWASSSAHPIFVSEYADLNGKLRIFANIPMRNRLAGAGGKAGLERLFMNDAAHRYIKARAATPTPALHSQKAELLNGEEASSN